jgi:hypothetical protein
VPYDLGDVVPLDFQAVDVSSAPANATSISLSVTTPDGVTASLTPIQGLPPDQTGSGTGWYYYDYVTTQVGRHTVRWVATGTPGPGVGVGAATDAWDVKSGADSTIIGLADAKRRLRLTATTQFDDDIREYLEAVTLVVEKLVGPVVIQTVTERVRAGDMFIALTKPPLYQPAGQTYQIISMTPVLTYGLTYDLSLLTVDMDHGFVRHKSGLPFIYGPYDVTYTAGRPAIGAHIILGTSIILRHLWGMERSGDRSGLVQPDNDTTVMYGFAIPNRAIELLTGGAGPREVGGFA